MAKKPRARQVLKKRTYRKPYTTKKGKRVTGRTVWYRTNK